MSKIVNTRGLVRPARTHEAGTDIPDPLVPETGLQGLKARDTRSPPPITRRQALDDLDDRPPQQHEEVPPPLPAPRGLTVDIPVAGVARVMTQAPMSGAALAEVMAALEQHGRRNQINHGEALGVLKRLKSLVEQVTERRSWPKIPRVRRRLQRKRRDQ